MPLLIVIFCILFYFPAFAQETGEKEIEVITDTVVVRKNSYIVTKDSIFFIDRDTVLYIQDTLRGTFEEILNKEDYKREKDFYKNLQEKLKGRKATKELLNLLLDISDDKKKQRKDSLAHIPKQYDGKIIGNITVKNIDVFGPEVTDTSRKATSKLARFFNKIHVNTREQVVFNNLLLEKGGLITRHKIADNERILRSLHFIRDARILLQPRSEKSDTVDLLIVTQDVMSLSGSVEPVGLKAARIHINDNNLLGTGHELDNAIIIEPKEKQYLGYRGTYHLPNIRGSFLQGSLSYFNTNFENTYRFQLLREFIVPAIKYAGGVEVSFNDRITFAPRISSFQVADTLAQYGTLPLLNYSYQYQDYWLARSFMPDFIIKNNRARIILALRYNRIYFENRPLVQADSNTAFHNSHQILAKLGFSKRYYTTEQLVYTYGRTEDVPIGHLIEFIAGPNFSEFYNRFYTGASYARGNYLNRLGYMSFNAELGGFWREGNLKEGIFKVGLQSFSYLIHWKRTKYRLFMNADYTTGIRRTQTIDFRDIYINIRDKNGIRGLSSNEMEGNERLTLSLESVAYTPFYLYGFKFAFFMFADIGWVSQQEETVFSSKTFQGYGLGIRVRNENLAFKTFQMRLAFYPIVPNGEQLFGFQLGGIRLPRFLDFHSKKPDTFRFN